MVEIQGRWVRLSANLATTLCLHSLNPAQALLMQSPTKLGLPLPPPREGTITGLPDSVGFRHD